MSSDPPSLASILRAALGPFIGGIVIASICWLACGITLGLFIGGVALTAIVLPPLTVRDEHPRHAFLAAASLVDGIAIVWLVAALMELSLLQWLQGYIVLIAFAAGLFGLTIALRRIVGPTGASAITTFVALAWLAWPIWLSPIAGPRTVAILGPVHPLFALNKVLTDLGFWTQQPLMYDLTTLGQDVPHALPQSILPCVLLHALMALSLGWPAWLWSAREASTPPPTATSPAA
jgi:hypothetical protein